MEPGGDEALAEMLALHHFKATFVDEGIDMVRVKADNLTVAMLMKHDFERVRYTRGHGAVGYTRLAAFVRYAHETFDQPAPLENIETLLSTYLECQVREDRNMTFRVIGLALIDDDTVQEAVNLCHRQRGRCTFYRFSNNKKISITM